jgi:hypothetical protein
MVASGMASVITLIIIANNREAGAAGGVGRVRPYLDQGLAPRAWLQGGVIYWDPKIIINILSMLLFNINRL